jgi:hypothetical protein
MSLEIIEVFGDGLSLRHCCYLSFLHAGFRAGLLLAREILDKSEIKISKMTGCLRVWPHGPLTRSHIIIIIIIIIIN